MPTRTIYLFDDLGNKVAVGTYEPAPVSLTVGGSWTNTQYTGSAPDPTGLTFTCTFSDGTSSSVVPTSVSPSTWSSTAGTQTATFSYTAGGVTVNGSKSASVEELPEPIYVQLNANLPSGIAVSCSLTGEGYYYPGNTVTVTASEIGSFRPFWTQIEGKTIPCTFSYWSDTFDGSNELTDSNTYTFKVLEDTTLYAIYLS